MHGRGKKETKNRLDQGVTCENDNALAHVYGLNIATGNGGGGVERPHARALQHVGGGSSRRAC